MAIPTDATIRRPKSFPFSGRLIALPTSNSLEVGRSLDLSDAISIDFPAMPDSIELTRSTEYFVQNSVFMPDGIHQYKGTKALEIPFSFSLHSYDEDFCPNGAYTLLQLAARLHSFTLPIDGGDGDTAIFAKAGDQNTSNHEGSQEARAASPDGGLGFTHIGGEKIFMPVTCRLELIFTDHDAPGIACTGYVREVSVKLRGPWLRGPGKSSNLPSSADFSFVFVHRPGHGNSFNINTTEFDLQPQAYAQTVKKNFYNTRHLVQAANYKGLTDAPTTASGTTPSTTPNTPTQAGSRVPARAVGSSVFDRTGGTSGGLTFFP